jgi:hypothetical protein
MPVHNSPEERKLISLIGHMPVPEEDRLVWIENLQINGLSEELAEQIRQKLMSSPVEDNEAAKAHRASSLTGLTRLIKQWRLSRQSHNFARH